MTARIYSIEKEEWRFDLKAKSKLKPAERRDHLAFLLRGELHVIGGHQGNHSDHLKDYHWLTLATMEWHLGTRVEHYFCRQ